MGRAGKFPTDVPIYRISTDFEKYDFDWRLRFSFRLPVPIILALLINELRIMTYKRIVQTVVYMPHFLSWVIVGGVVVGVLSPSTGIVNHLLGLFGVDPIYF